MVLRETYIWEKSVNGLRNEKTIALASFHALTALVPITMFQRSVALGIVVLREGEMATSPPTGVRQAATLGSTTIKVWNFYLKIG